MEHKMFIYFITNNIDNKFYIGQTLNLDTRLKRHLYFLKSGLHRIINMIIIKNMKI